MINEQASAACQDTDGRPAQNDQYYPHLLMLFVLSGCSALIYEVVWFQMLKLVIGLSALSMGVLLAAYMGGMFLGSILLARLITAKSHPLRVYALLEMGIGITGIVMLFGIPYLDQLYITSAGSGLASILLRCAVCLVCLLPPTVLMGATLPAAARWVERSPLGVSWLGFFYSGNIAGAVVGCLLAGFYLLRVFDVAVATYLAASINFAVAAVGFWLASRTHHPAPPAAGPAEGPARDPGYQLVYAVTAISGFCALGAEVVWTRLLSHYLGNTVYTFAIILAVFLAGLGVGSSSGALLLKRVGHPRTLLGLCQLLLTAAIAWAAFAITHTSSFWPVNPVAAYSPWTTFVIDFLRSLAAVLPAAALWGASFPLALASVVSGNRDQGALVGEVYAANTFGAIVGAIGFSLLVIPQIGTQHAQQMMVWSSGGAALLMFPLLLPESQKSEELWFGKRFATLACRYPSLIACLGLSACFAWLIPETPWPMVAGPFLSTWSDRLVPGIVAEKDVPSGGGKPDIYGIYLGEGMNESVVVIKRKDGMRCYYAAGKSQATSDLKDMRLQRMLGHISALTVEKPESVLVVACGAGVTAGTYTLYPSIKRLVICELEKLVPESVAPLFKKENYDVVHNPRTEVVIDDGRHYVRTSKEKFDVITSDPVDPWIKGAAALYTEEYFTACRNHLNPGGVMALWIPFYGISTESVKSLFAAFFKAFPEGMIWSNADSGRGYDAVLFGQAGPAHIDIDKVQQRMNELPQVAQSLREVGFNSSIDLFGTFAGYGPLMQPWLWDAQVNTDRTLRLQYLNGLSFNNFLGSQILDEIALSFSFPDKVFSGSARSISELKGKIEKKP